MIDYKKRLSTGFTRGVLQVSQLSISPNQEVSSSWDYEGQKNISNDYSDFFESPFADNLQAPDYLEFVQFPNSLYKRLRVKKESTLHLVSSIVADEPADTTFRMYIEYSPLPPVKWSIIADKEFDVTSTGLYHYQLESTLKVKVGEMFNTRIRGYGSGFVEKARDISFRVIPML